ncbi:hypothetical protein [Burkholderia mayonis]|nr:hypothetical protein [Burkholderia mayonis]
MQRYTEYEAAPSSEDAGQRAGAMNGHHVHEAVTGLPGGASAAS